MATYQPVARASFSMSGIFNPLPLLTDGDDVVSRTGTIASGIGVVNRGTIVKYDPATGAITLPAAAADCNAIMAESADATSATVAALVIVSGKVSAAALIWPAALGHGVVTDALRDFSILVESVVYTDGTLIKSAPTPEEEAAAKAKLDAARAAAKAAADAAAAAPPATPPADQPKPSDSPWAYMTAEERQNDPQLAEAALAEPTTPPAAPATPPPTTPPPTTP